MLVGYNHNIRHKGKLYHIQTEDSGLPNMYVTTLLYSAGTIIASQKTEYSDFKGKENFEEDIRLLMQNQHKAILIKLKDGVYDDPEQAQLEEPEEVKRKDELSILDAIKEMEARVLEKIIADSKEDKEDTLSKKKKIEEAGFDKMFLDFVSSELSSKKDEEKE